MPEKYKNRIKHREIYERYCHIIGKNTVIVKIHDGDKISTECLNSRVCDESGGCKNTKFVSG